MASSSDNLDSSIYNNGNCDKIQELQFFIDQLPNHILQQIFDRLSPMDLTSCWYVSKTWSCLIKHSKYEKPKTFVLQFVPNESKEHTNLFSVDLEFDTKNPISMKIVNQYKIPPYLRFINSCNSLLSLCDSFEPRNRCCVYILNPMKGEYLKLPDTPTERTNHDYFYGLGFSKKSNKYKMMRIVYISINMRIVEVCVLDVNPHRMTWKNIGLLPYHDIGTCPCVYFHGALYWIAYGMDSDRAIICRFDVEDEKFQPIKLPIDTHIFTLMYDSPYHNYPFIQIGVLDDDFYFLYCLERFRNPVIEMWLMKENGVNDHLWTKHLVIKPPPRIEGLCNYLNPWLTLIKVFENGEILMVCEAKLLVLYDPLTKSYRDVKFNSTDHYDLVHQNLETLSFSSLKNLLRGENADSVS